MAQKLNTQTSIVDYLKSKGEDSSMKSRTVMAGKQGISGYKGTAQQNTKLLSAVQNRKAKVPLPGAPSKGVGQSPVERMGTGAGEDPLISMPTAVEEGSGTKRNTVVNPNIPKTGKGITQNPVEKSAYSTTSTEDGEPQSMEDAFEAYKDFLKQQTESSYDSQKALLDSANAQRLAELKKALDRAIADGELSQEDANKQFAENVDAINQDAYNNSQATELSGQQRGIGNSQQLLAMQQGDQRHQTQLTNDSRTARDDRISSIKQKLMQITNENALDVSTSNQMHANSLLSARAQADGQYAAGMSQLSMEQYRAELELKNQLTMQEQAFLDEMAKMEKQQGYTRENMELGQKYAEENMDREQGYTQDNMKLGQMFEQENMKLNQKYTQANMDKQQKLDLSKMSTQQKYQLETLAKQYGYDMNKMSASQLHEFNIIAKQHGYSKEMTGINQSFERGMQQNQFNHAKDMSATEFSQQLSMMTKQNEQQWANNLKEYDLAVSRELSKHTKGTKEYDILQAQLAQERDALVQEQHTATSYDAISKEILEGQTTKPSKPKKSWWEPQSFHDKDMKEYDEKMAAYKRYQDYLANPSSALP